MAAVLPPKSITPTSNNFNAIGAILPPHNVAPVYTNAFNADALPYLNLSGNTNPGPAQDTTQHPKTDWSGLLSDVGGILQNVGNIVQNVKHDKNGNVIPPTGGAPAPQYVPPAPTYQKPFNWTPVIIVGVALTAITITGFMTNWFGMAKK